MAHTLSPKGKDSMLVRCSALSLSNVLSHAITLQCTEPEETD